MNLLSVVLWLFLSFGANFVRPISYSVSDYRDLNSKAQQYKFNKSCSSFSARISMIEHFFTLVYNEFEGNPPVCVCVQMCESQPLFCYPNGCLRRDPTFSGNNIRLKFDIATFPPTQVAEKTEQRFENSRYGDPSRVESQYQHKINENQPHMYNDKPVTDINRNKNVFVKPVGHDQLLPVDLKYFDKKFKSVIKFPVPVSKVLDIPKEDRYAFMRTDTAGKYLTEEEYRAAEDQFRRHLHVSP